MIRFGNFYHDVESGSEITPCNDDPSLNAGLVALSFLRDLDQ